MHLGEQSINLRIRVNESIVPDVQSIITAALSNQELEEYSFLSLNQWSIRVLPLPVLTDVRPGHIYNLATVKNITVKGENFVNAGSQLQCIFTGLPSPSVVHSNQAVFVSTTELNCSFGLPAALMKAKTI